MLHKIIIGVTLATAFQVDKLNLKRLALDEAKNATGDMTCEGFTDPDECYAGPQCKWFVGDNFAQCRKDCSFGSGSQAECQQLVAGSSATSCFWLHDLKGKPKCVNSFNIDCPPGSARTFPGDTVNPLCKDNDVWVHRGAICDGANDATYGNPERECKWALDKICVWQEPILPEHKVGGTNPQPYCVPRSRGCDKNNDKEHCQNEWKTCQYVEAEGEDDTEKGKNCIAAHGRSACFEDQSGNIGACLPADTETSDPVVLAIRAYLAADEAFEKELYQADVRCSGAGQCGADGLCGSNPTDGSLCAYPPNPWDEDLYGTPDEVVAQMGTPNPIDGSMGGIDCNHQASCSPCQSWVCPLAYLNMGAVSTAKSEASAAMYEAYDLCDQGEGPCAELPF